MYRSSVVAIESVSLGQDNEAASILHVCNISTNSISRGDLTTYSRSSALIVRVIYSTLSNRRFYSSLLASKSNLKF